VSHALSHDPLVLQGFVRIGRTFRLICGWMRFTQRSSSRGTGERARSWSIVTARAATSRVYDRGGGPVAWLGEILTPG